MTRCMPLGELLKLKQLTATAADDIKDVIAQTDQSEELSAAAIGAISSVLFLQLLKIVISCLRRCSSSARARAAGETPGDDHELSESPPITGTNNLRGQRVDHVLVVEGEPPARESGAIEAPPPPPPRDESPPSAARQPQQHAPIITTSRFLRGFLYSSNRHN